MKSDGVIAGLEVIKASFRRGGEVMLLRGVNAALFTGIIGREISDLHRGGCETVSRVQE